MSWLQHTSLTASPLGLPSLMAGRTPTLTPLGHPVVWMISHPLVYLLLWGLLILVGLFLGALYLEAIAQQVREARFDWRQLRRSVWGKWLQLTVFMGILTLIALGAGLPLIFVISLIAAFSPEAAQLLLALTLLTAIWLLFYFCFALPGLFVQRRNLWLAMGDSLRLMQWNFGSTLLLNLIIFIIGGGLTLVWNTPREDSWLMLIGVAGHACVSTALIASVFIFYQDCFRRWELLRRAHLASSQSQQANG